jgi:hypothetical protein
MTFSLMRATLQGSPGSPLPLYLNPVEPGGLPSAFHPPEGREAVIDSLPPTVSKMSRVAPPTLGPTPGRLKSDGLIGFATILASVPDLTM